MKIVFVCTGNACRSAATEVVLKKMIEDSGISNVEVSSCGTKVHGCLERDEVMCQIAAEKEYALGKLKTFPTPTSNQNTFTHLLRHHRVCIQRNNQKN